MGDTFCDRIFVLESARLPTGHPRGTHPGAFPDLLGGWVFTWPRLRKAMARLGGPCGFRCRYRACAAICRWAARKSQRFHRRRGSRLYGDCAVMDRHRSEAGAVGKSVMKP